MSAVLTEHIAEEPRSQFEPYPDEIRQAVVKAVIAGKTYRDVAAQFDVSLDTISRWVNTNRKVLMEQASALAMNWRERQAALAHIAVCDALMDRSDNYKRAGIAQQALKGLGHYGADSAVRVEAHFHSAGALAVIADARADRQHSDAGSSTAAAPEASPAGPVI